MYEKENVDFWQKEILMTQAPDPQQPVAPQPPMAPPPGTMPPKRPGGLTALAVLNFVFGGLGVIGIFGWIALLSVAEQVVVGLSEGQASLTQAPGAGTIYLGIILSIVSVGLLIVSGVGYIGQKKVLGYCLGSAYGVLGIIGAIVSIVTTGFGVMVAIGLIYPLLTLILLNTAFKSAFVK